MTAMTTRERFHALMNFQPVDRLPIVEWAVWWDKTIARWHTEGLPATMTDRYEICRHLGLEVYKQDWISPWLNWEKLPITCMDDYLAIRGEIYPDAPVNLDRFRAWAEEQRRGEIVIWFSLQGYFWYPRTLFGIEPHFYAFYDEPELMHLMNEDLTKFNLRAIEQITSVCTPDFMTFAEDMSYNHGPMLSRTLFDEFLAPHYRQVVPVLQEHGIMPIVDSDGDVTELAPWLEDVGIQGILPLERQAGVDITALRAAHPRMRFIGHFDKMTMNRGVEAVRAEFERLLPTARQGGFLVSVDHQTPPGVSLEEYRQYIDLFREYAVKVASV